jgi:hypothetical protein
MRERIVVLADRGLGVLATLRRARSELANSEEALTVAFTEIISGRYPEIRGNGLKFVKSIIINNPFSISFQTGDAYLSLDNTNKDVVVQKIDNSIRGCFAIIRFESLI